MVERSLQAEESGAPDFIEHLLSIPKGGPEDLFDGLSLDLRDMDGVVSDPFGDEAPRVRSNHGGSDD